METVTVDRPAVAAPSAEAASSKYEPEPVECLHCARPIGREACHGLLFDDPEVGLVGFLHSTNCVDVFYGLHLTDPDAWRLVEVA